MNQEQPDAPKYKLVRERERERERRKGGVIREREGEERRGRKGELEYSIITMTAASCPTVQ